MLTRETLRKALRDRLYSCPDALAVWEAGSAAFDRADERSDLDIGVLARGDALDPVWCAVEQGLEDVGGFSIRWENPTHIFKGMTQRIYRPRAAPRWLDLDIGVFQESAPDLYLQPQRHGRAEVLFDRSLNQRTGACVFDEAAHRRRMAEALHQEIMRWHLYRDFVTKELERGRTIDAFGFYITFALRPVLTVLGMLHRSDRFDYGFRYVKDELPADAVAAVERLCYVASPCELPARLKEAANVFTKSVRELKRRGIEPVDPSGVDVTVGKQKNPDHLTVIGVLV